MQQYLIKANFYKPEDLVSARSEMVLSGIPLANIDQLTIRNESGKHLFFGRITRGPEFALKFLPVGFVIGIVAYVLSIFSGKEARGIWNVLEQISLFNLIFVTLSFGYLFMFLGYFFGKRSMISTIEYSNKKSHYGRNVLMVSTDEANKKAVLNILNSFRPTSLDIVNSKFEEELGLGKQNSA